MESEMRQKFEAHWQAQTKGGDGSWTTLERLAAWEAYQAAYIAGLREAAGICESNSAKTNGTVRLSAHNVDKAAILARADELEKGR